VADPATGRMRVLRLPTMKGDFLDRLTRSGGRLVWMAPGGTFAIDERLNGRPQKLSSLPFVVSTTPGRLWFISHPRGAERRTGIIEKTVRGKVTLRALVRVRCRGAIVAAVAGALLCQEGHDFAAIDPGSGEVLRRVRGSFPFATQGTTVAACDDRCATVTITDVATGHARDVAPPRGSRFIQAYDGAFSPAGSTLAVPLASIRASADPKHLRVALIREGAGTAVPLPGSHLATDYRKLSWAPSGELYFAAPGARLMRFGPGDRRATLLSVHFRRPILDLAAG
jgi:hypothetical protein